jgi:hypothetical protein
MVNPLPRHLARGDRGRRSAENAPEGHDSRCHLCGIAPDHAERGTGLGSHAAHRSAYGGRHGDSPLLSLLVIPAAWMLIMRYRLARTQSSAHGVPSPA